MIDLRRSRAQAYPAERGRGRRGLRFIVANTQKGGRSKSRRGKGFSSQRYQERQVASFNNRPAMTTLPGSPSLTDPSEDTKTSISAVVRSGPILGM
jgi:hypothetical protein